MNILLAGASGFIGERVTEKLLAQGFQVTAMVHSARSAKETVMQFPTIRIVTGDIADPATLTAVDPDHIDAIIYLPGLLREFPSKGITFKHVHVDGVKNLLHFAKQCSVKRWIQMSALGAGRNINTPYFTTKEHAEQLIKGSGLDWTILRPSVVFPNRPTPKANFISELAAVVKKAPLIPLFGKGDFLLQPISVDDLSSVIAQSVANTNSYKETLEIGGPGIYTYKKILRLIADAMNVHKPFLSIPLPVIRTLTTIFEKFSFFPLTGDQLTMLTEGNIVKDPNSATVLKKLYPFELERLENGINKVVSNH